MVLAIAVGVKKSISKRLTARSLLLIASQAQRECRGNGCPTTLVQGVVGYTTKSRQQNFGFDTVGDEGNPADFAKAKSMAADCCVYKAAVLQKQ